MHAVRKIVLNDVPRFVSMDLSLVCEDRLTSEICTKRIFFHVGSIMWTVLRGVILHHPSALLCKLRLASF